MIVAYCQLNARFKRTFSLTGIVGPKFGFGQSVSNRSRLRREAQSRVNKRFHSRHHPTPPKLNHNLPVSRPLEPTRNYLQPTYPILLIRRDYRVWSVGHTAVPLITVDLIALLHLYKWHFYCQCWYHKILSRGRLSLKVSRVPFYYWSTHFVASWVGFAGLKPHFSNVHSRIRY